tara:strand:- start:328 stop:957 length:630 start_codon:yes stop_codon:yes gene_type:complete
MANHVYFNIELSLDAAQTCLVENLGKQIYSEQGEMKWPCWEVEKLPIYPVKYEENDWYMWGCENMGAKWVVCEEWNETTISGHSAWSPVIPFIKNLIQHIYDEVGGNPSAKMTYEDEFRNFVGIHECWIEDDTVYDDYNEIEGQDLNDLMLEAFNKEEKWFQSEEFDWWEVYPIAMKGHAYKGEDWEPQQYCDELVYQFFSNGRLEHLT